MKTFLQNAIIFIIILTFILSVLDVMVTKGLRKSNDFVYDNMTKIFNSQIDANLIINGSSKALCQIDPKIIDTLLSVRSYNFGMNGTGFEIQELVYNLYRKHNKKPDIIIQILSNGTLSKNLEMHEYKKFAPYLDDRLVKEKALKLKGFDQVDFYVPFMRYSGFSIDIINGLSNCLGFKLPTDTNTKYKGYYAQSSEWNNSFQKYKVKYPNGRRIIIDNDLVRLLDSYIKKGTKEGIKMVLIYPPTYYESQKYITNREELIKMYKTIAENNNVLFLDYSSDELTNSKEYFFDSQHLNKKGAEIFTEKLALRIMKEKALPIQRNF